MLMYPSIRTGELHVFERRRPDDGDGGLDRRSQQLRRRRRVAGMDRDLSLGWREN